MKKITVEKIINMINEGKVFVTESQMAINPVAAIIQKMIFPLRNTTTKEVVLGPEFRECEGKIYGDTITHLAQLGDTYYILSDASEVMSIYNFLNGEGIQGGYVSRNPKMQSYFRRISGGKKYMTYKNLPVSIQKKLRKISLTCDITEVKSLSEVIELRKSMCRNSYTKDKILITNEYTTFFSMFGDLAHSLFRNRYGVIPEFYGDLSNETKNAFKSVAENIRKTRLGEFEILQLLLLSVDAANYNYRMDKSGAVETYNFICEKHANDSRTKCLDIISNTLLNLSVVPKLLDDARQSHPMLWIGAVHLFGQYSKVSYIKKKDRHQLIRLSDSKIRTIRGTFNEKLEQCLTGAKTSFDGSNIQICRDASGDGMVFNHKTVDTGLHEVSNLYITTAVMQAIYNEI